MKLSNSSKMKKRKTNRGFNQKAIKTLSIKSKCDIAFSWDENGIE